MKQNSTFITAVILSVLFSATAICQSQNISPELRSLVEAERAFAKYSVDNGQREAFLQFFADDGVNFVPQPANTKEALNKRPPTPKPPPFTLNWQPIFGDISAAGDLGFTTGPYTLADNSSAKRPTQHGMFFSVWKKQADKNWKVVADFGISTPEAVAPLTTAFVPATHSFPPSVKNDPAALLEIETDYGKAVKVGGLREAYTKYLSNDVREYAPDVMPVIGKEVYLNIIGNPNAIIDYLPLHADIAASGDLGYIYGSYDARIKKGYYLRVWRKKIDGQFEIAAEVFNWLPDEKKTIQPRPEDIASIDGIIKAFYEVISGPAGQPRQWDRDRTLYVPGVRFIALSSKVKASTMDHDQYVKVSNDAMVKNGFFEEEIHRVTNHFGNVAQVFSIYQEKLKLDGDIIGRGVNSIQLYFDGTRWWISAVTWQSESADNPIPKEYLRSQ